MSAEFRAESYGAVAPGAMFVEVGTVAFNGCEFTSKGAYVTDDRLVAYLSIAGSRVTTWHGQTIGRYRIVKTWRVPTRRGDWYDMAQVSVALDDGRRYQGRSQGPGMVVTAKRCAGDRRQS